MCAKECMLSKNVQGFCFFLYFPKQSTKLIINLKSLKIPEAKQLLRVGRTMFEFFKNVILLIVTEMTFMLDRFHIQYPGSFSEI